MSSLDAWVSAEFQRLAEIINQYDPNLFLEYITNPTNLDDHAKCFRIVDDRTKTVVMYFDSVSNPTQILERLWSSDLDKNDVVGKMDARNAAIEALQNQERLEQLGMAKEFADFILRNTKSRWHHAGRLYDDQFRDLGPVAKIIDVSRVNK